MWQARIFTLYPEIFPGPLNKGLYGKALSNKIWNLDTVNIRDVTEDKHKTVDDTIFGGGSGMLIKPDVLARSIDQNVKSKEKIFYLSPKGKLFDQKTAKFLAKENCINLIHSLEINKILINTFYLSQKIEQFIKDKKFNLEIKIINDGSDILNTGGGILNMINSSNETDFITFNPDTVWNENYKKHIKDMEKLYFLNKKRFCFVFIKKKNYKNITHKGNS